MKRVLMIYIRMIVALVLWLNGTDATAQMGVNWINSGSNNFLTMYISPKVKFKLPTSDVYELGFFKHTGGGLFTCFGSIDITEGTAMSLNVGLDKQGQLGYTYKDRFMALVRNKTTLKVYGVELHFRNDSSVYYNQTVATVDSVISATWYNFWPSPQVCSNSDTLLLKLPYGLIPDEVQKSAGVNLVTVTNDTYKLVINGLLMGIDYTVSFPIAALDNKYLSYSFRKYAAPVNVPAVVHDSICAGKTIELPLLDPNTGLNRKAADASYTLSITAPGTYYYRMTDLATGCYVPQSYEVVKCHDQYPGSASNKLFVNLSAGESVELYQQDEFTIYDLSLHKVKTIHAPATWKGEDDKGNLLPMGMYIMINSRKEVTYITLAY